MKGKIKVILLLGLTVFLPTIAQYSVNFESDTAGTHYSMQHWLKNGFLQLDYLNGYSRTSIDDSIAHSGKKSLRIFYPEGGVGPSETGHQAPCELEPAKEYYLSYWLRFSENFSWGGENHGGKLPGLAAGDKCSGGQVCDGTNGFTARFMWRTNGRAALYLYYMDKVNKWGDDFELKSKTGEAIYFPRGEWVNIIERVKINSGSNKDGEVQVWFNGEEVLSIENLQFVSDESKVDDFYFSSFHGGNEKSWSPQNSCYIWVDDILISTQATEIF